MERLAAALEYCNKLKAKRERLRPIRPAIKPINNRVGVGFVYLIGCHNLIKVGTAINPAKRLIELQVGNPYELRLLATFESYDYARYEKKLHHLWRQYEVRGEWFNIPDGELAFVMSAQSIEELFN